MTRSNRSPWASTPLGSSAPAGPAAVKPSQQVADRYRDTVAVAFRGRLAISVDRRSASGRLDGVEDGLYADHAVLEDERVDGVVGLAAASGRLPLQVEHVVGENGLELPGR